VAVLGGSTTWGFGLRAGESFPAQLEQILAHDQPAGPQTIRVLNLGFNNEGAYSFTQTLNDYEYLDPDLVILYSGYNDLNGPNYYNFRHRSPLFAWTGYLPLLPSLTLDKLSVWKQQLTGANEKPVFTPPNLDRRPDASGLRQRLDAQSEPSPRNSDPALCSPQWQFYCDRVNATAAMALAKGKRVLVVTEPYISDTHVEQQTELESMLAARFAKEPRLRYVNLGPLIDLRDPSLCWDGMHLTTEGNRQIAAALAQSTTNFLR